MKNENQDITEIEENRTEYRISSLAGCGEYLVQEEELNGRSSGVYYVAGENSVSFLCSLVVVEAMYRDIDNIGWGRLLILRDHDDRCHNYIMSAATLGKDEASIVGELRDHGVTVTTKRKHHYLVADYLLNTAPRKSQRIRSTAKSGWQDDNVYIFPDNSVIGESPEQYILQRQTSASLCCSSGNNEDWQNVASLCSGNSRLIFAICVAFSGPMLTPTGYEGGGFHLFGTSSDGKTTILHVAASVLGRPQKYIQTWRATDNGLEGIAKLHNDSLLILDELGEIAPQDAGKVSYFLANGSGKTRARVTGDAKPKAEWRLNYLSSGEITLAEHMAEAGKQAKAGQEVRHVDIPANAGAGKGVFENIHTCGTPAEFADLLKQRASQ